jgi:hypothetical protein
MLFKQKTKIIPRESLIVRPSMSLYFGGGEIWFEQLDALSVYTDIVKDKFLGDLKTIRKPSSPSRIAVNLNETFVDHELAELIAKELLMSEGFITKIAFVGLDSKAKSMLEAVFKKFKCFFEYKYFSDYEKSKEWLVGEHI